VACWLNAVSRHGEAVIFSDGPWGTALGLFAIVFLVFANGFLRWSVALCRAVAFMRLSATSSWTRLRRTATRANSAATKISSLALGWVGEPALAHLIEPLLGWLPPLMGNIGAHALARRAAAR
jgi:putative hemolysin